ncbi:ABC transporter ATP-binding protein [Nanchangia anserum]|uniref:ABC transporter ATP-binding protein n=1 Tax=Nanchangia anserum TaxID=2692125 RepID=A0A8I0G927_9ACTO|nr:ABC transporter ATP-binding protein [Nanchangia anserum]MBD3690180.1 ABC transporter ATP-binding protein [Nanchangia anserum]QOX82365.1 ABC transporter ATP-binding protein [Nanchangia anserum]
MRLFVRHYPGRVAVYLVVALISVTLETGVAFILAALANSVTGGNGHSPIKLAAFGLVYLIPLALFDWLRAVTVTRLQTRFTAALRGEIVDSALASTLPRDRAIVATGEGLQGALINDAKMIGEDYAYAFFFMIEQAMLLVAGLIGTAVINPVFIPIVLVLSIFGMLLPKCVEKPLTAVQKRVADANNTYLDRVTLVSSGLESLLSIRRTRRVQHVVKESIADLEAAENSRFATRNFMWTLTWVFGLVIIIGVWGIGAKLAALGWISIGGIVALAQLMTQVAGPLQSAAEQYSQIIAGRQQYRELKQKLAPSSDTQEISEDPRVADDNADERGARDNELRLDDFSVHADEHALLEDVSLTLPRGARVLISGPSGAGKTSLLRGLAGLQTSAGTITLNGATITPATPREQHVRLITQRPVVIPGSLADNIDPDMTGTQGELARTGHRDVLGPLVDRLNDNPAQPIDKLSGGETRRVHVATGLAAPGEVLLLDEITTGLDTPSAARVLQTALSMNRDYVFAVAHDLPLPPRELGFTHILEIRDGRMARLSDVA